MQLHYYLISMLCVSLAQMILAPTTCNSQGVDLFLACSHPGYCTNKLETKPASMAGL